MVKSRMQEMNFHSLQSKSKLRSTYVFKKTNERRFPINP